MFVIPNWAESPVRNLLFRRLSSDRSLIQTVRWLESGNFPTSTLLKNSKTCAQRGRAALQRRARRPQSTRASAPVPGRPIQAVRWLEWAALSRAGLLKNSVSIRLWEGHEFTRAVKSIKIGRASAPEVYPLLARRSFPRAEISRRSSMSTRRSARERKPHFASGGVNTGIAGL